MKFQGGVGGVRSWRRLVAVVTAMVGVPLVAVVGTPPPPAGAALSTWVTVASPNTATTDANQLAAVSADARSDVWAVGWSNNGTYDQTLAEHYDGTSWSIVPTADTSTTLDNRLLGVTALSPTNVWAVGYASNGTVDQTLIEHYDGTSWSIVTSPDTSTTELNELTGIGSDSTGDLWAVGLATVGTSGSYAQTLIEQYDPTTSSWSVVTSPNTSTTLDNRLLGVTVVSATDAWAVGSASNGTVDQTLTEQWNGTAWAIVASPDTVTTSPNGLSAVSADSASDAWAVGYAYSGLTPEPLAEQWNGTSWAVVAAQDPSTSATSLTGVDALSPTDVWAVGSQNTGTVEQTLIENYNGTSWSVATSPDTSVAANNAYAGVAAVSAATLWAVGSANAGAVPQTLIATTPLTPTLTLTSSANPSVTGQATTYSVSVAGGIGAPVATGAVIFSDGAAVLCDNAALDASGAATCTTSLSTAGAHTVTATYSGDDNYLAAAAQLSQQVNPDPTTLTLVSSANPAPASSPVVFTATWSATAPGTGTPTGTVTFENGGTAVPSCTDVPLGAFAAAQCILSFDTVGTDDITAVFGNDPNFAASTSNIVAETVAAGSLSVTETPAGQNGGATTVTLTPVTLNSTPGTASGVLNTVVVNDNRGTACSGQLCGWSVSAQLELPFQNLVPNGDPAANVLPAGTATITPSVTPGNPQSPTTGVTSGPSAALSTSASTPVCSAAAGAGGGTYDCNATLSVSVPPYVAAGTYQAVVEVIASSP